MLSPGEENVQPLAGGTAATWASAIESASDALVAAAMDRGRQEYRVIVADTLIGVIQGLTEPATRLGDQGERLLVGVTAGDDSPVLTTEYFAPVLGVVELPAGPEGFLATAVDYVNDRLEGTLGANIVVAPRDRKALGARFDEAIAKLRYGTVAVNAWTALGFLTAAATWGAFPGHTLRDVQSGIGIVHNSMLLDRPERTVIEGPFRPFPRSVLHGEMTLSPKPPWFVTARTAARTSELLTRFAAAPSWSRVPRIVLSAFRG